VGRFYDSKEWHKLRGKILRAFPLCQALGCSEPSKRVDHIKAIRDGGAPLEAANLQALCVSCHNSKTARNDGGFGNRRKSLKGTVSMATGQDGRPLDPKHHWNKGSGEGETELTASRPPTWILR
jgi:5-methylcytosine-specific restriction enzyme A